MAKKKIAVLMAVMLLIGVASGATLAWLTSHTDPVKNVFTVGDINIALNETKAAENTNGTRTFHVVPGDTLDKDPYVTVLKDSEDCYVFVRMTVENNFVANTTTGEMALQWDILDDWTFVDMETGTALEEANVPYATKSEGVYYMYRTYTLNANEDVKYGIIAEDVVNISEFVTKEHVEAFNENNPVISFNAAAIQSQNIITEGASEADNLKAIVKQLKTDVGGF